MSNTSKQEFKKLPGVMSLTRRISVTDALFYSLMPDASEKPLDVMRGGLRGTQNVNQGKKEARDVNNIQMTDVAKTDLEAEGLVVRVGIRFMPLEEGINSLALSKSDDKSLLIDFKNSFDSFVRRAIVDKDGLHEVACRYARNMANGRWLWRNRQFAQNVETEIRVDGQNFAFNALKISTKEFGNYSDDEIQLGTLIAASLSGEKDLTFEVKGFCNFGKGMNSSLEVYPSQNFLTDKPKGFARSLYSVGQSKLTRSPELIEFESIRLVGHAAIRDTKIANALRTIDTWYPGYRDYDLPIAVEPLGANLATQILHRDGNEHSSFAYFKKLNSIDPNSDKGMFVIASIIRGGVYSEGKEK